MKIIKALSLLLSVVLLSACASDNAPNVPSPDDIPADELITVPEMTLSAIYIDTETGTDVKSKEEYILTDFRIVMRDGRETISQDVKIRGRGNQSWGVAKKSYKLKFPEKAALISYSDYENKDWLLIANHADKSMIRNITAYELGRALDGVEWSPMSEAVDVYLNGKYRGVYILTERIEVAKGRVNINEEGDNIGFLFEMDNYAKGSLFTDYFIAGPRKYSLHSDFETPSQVKALASHVTKAYNAALAGDYAEISQYLDLDSVIDMYLICEYMRNLDTGWSSFYMYTKETDGKIYFGPPWDFDLSSGNTTNAPYTDGLYVGNLYGMPDGDSHNHVWYTALMKHEWFRELVRDRWNEVKSTIALTVDSCCDYVYDNLYSFERNFTRWDVLSTRINQEPVEVLKLSSCKANVDYMNDWLDKRFTWLDECFNSDEFIDGILYNN